MICFNRGGPGHYVGNCVNPKSYFISEQNHNVKNFVVSSKVQPIAVFFGSGARGFEFYHVDVLVANESNRLNFENCVVVNILKGEVDKALMMSLFTDSFCKTKLWP